LNLSKSLIAKIMEFMQCNAIHANKFMWDKLLILFPNDGQGIDQCGRNARFQKHLAFDKQTMTVQLSSLTLCLDIKASIWILNYQIILKLHFIPT